MPELAALDATRREVASAPRAADTRLPGRARTRTRPFAPPSPGHPVLGLLLALTSLLVVVTCSATTRVEGATPPGPAGFEAPPPAPEPPEPPPALPSEPAAAAPEPRAPAALPGPAPLSLVRFFAALRALEQRARQSHVHVVWLGDSHTAADLWTEGVRHALQARFGVGGPGFFHVGLKQTRHSQVKTDVFGSWQRVPAQPARTEPFLDGVFGLAGVRATAKDGASFKAKLRAGAVVGKARWSVHYRAPARSSFQLKLGAHTELIRGSTASPATIQHFERELEPDGELVLRQLGGMPEFYGATVESSEPGVVLDTLGIDGARAKTPLAWRAEAWERELAARHADLVVLAYGTNEVFESRAASIYAGYYRELLQRVRRVAPDADCLIIGPTDVMQTLGQSHPRVVEISSVQAQVAGELGCGYVGAHELMGGEGSYSEWQTAKPQLAGADGVHLTVRGYQELGQLTSELLMRGYDRFVGSQAPASP
ncbi:MAG TPA: GDSL-type esterase/lipase family protein [Polyangiaceae bacterium]